VWTPQDEEQLIEFMERGMSVPEITVHTGRGRNSICFKVHGLRKEGRITAAKKVPRIWKASELDLLMDMHREGSKSMKEMGAIIGRSTKAVELKIRAHGGSAYRPQRKWGEKDDLRLRQLWSQGVLKQDIAVELKRTYKYINVRVMELGLPQRHRGPYTAEDDANIISMVKLGWTPFFLLLTLLELVVYLILCTYLRCRFQSQSKCKKIGRK
jgi:hypothetical protein